MNTSRDDVRTYSGQREARIVSKLALCIACLSLAMVAVYG